MLLFHYWLFGLGVVLGVGHRCKQDWLLWPIMAIFWPVLVLVVYGQGGK